MQLANGGSQIVRLSTSKELITVADCQSSRHRLDTEAVVFTAGFILQTGCLYDDELRVSTASWLIRMRVLFLRLNTSYGQLL